MVLLGAYNLTLALFFVPMARIRAGNILEELGEIWVTGYTTQLNRS